jgi:triosephosphate isomerase
MAVARTPFIAGNWKMNFDHLQAIAFVQKLSWTLGDVKHDFGAVEVAVFPPFTDLRSVQTLLAADKMALRLGAQDVSEHEIGAHTGEVAASFLSNLDVDYVLVGHSERRTAFGETNAIVANKARAALANGLIPIICVGETAEDRELRGAASVPIEQLAECISELPKDADIVIAYEPVWAIGTGNAATPEDAEAVAVALREVLRDVLGDERDASTRILYGGSVKSENVASIMREPNIDGVLVGGASIDVHEFSRIVQFQKHVGR